MLSVSCQKVSRGFIVEECTDAVTAFHLKVSRGFITEEYTWGCDSKQGFGERYFCDDLQWNPSCALCDSQSSLLCAVGGSSCQVSPHATVDSKKEDGCSAVSVSSSWN